ncbi:MAG: dTDP-glucose 4,6-dehydratase [Chromatiales bacterium]|jgi:dTDP-glucose 4,6-dehydratase
MANLLVTGAAGFIGANFVHYWFEHHPGDRLVALDKLTYAGNRANLDAVTDRPGFEFVHGNIGDEPLVVDLLKRHDIDVLVHFAAESHVDRSIAGPDAFIETNIVGTHSLLKAAKQVWLDGGGKPHRFHHVSTDEVYGTLGPNDAPFSETTPYAPNSPYAASKAASDHLVRAYHETYGLQVTTSNCSNNYGPYQFPEKLIPLVMLNILAGKKLPIYGDGKQIRDWLYVDDHARGIDLVLQKGALGETYNIGGNNEWTNIDIVQLLCAEMDKRLAEHESLRQHFPEAPASQGGRSVELIEYVKDRAGHDRRYAIDATKSRGVLGYEPAYSFEAGIQKTIDWYLDNENWWRAVQDGSYLQWLQYQYTQR